MNRLETTSAPEVVVGRDHPTGPASLRVASFADYGRISALQTRNGLHSPLCHDWEALWKDNPAYKCRRDHWPIGWVLETASGEIVGSIGNVPLAYRFKGRDLLATSPYGWVVDPEYRAYSVAMLAPLASQGGIDLIVCTTVGPASERIWRLLQSRVPAGTWDKSRFWITNHRGFARSVLRRKSVPLPALLSYPVSFALFCRDKIAGARRLKDPKHRVEECSDFDSRFDEFWLELERQSQDTLLPVRTRETLRWHFQRSLRLKGASVLAVSVGPRLVAYAVFDRQDRPDLGLNRARLVDFQCLEGFECSIRSVMRWILRKCRQEGVHVVENTGCWLDRRELPRLPASHERALSCWFYYYKAIDRHLAEELKNPKLWSPSSYDGDSSL